MMTLREQWMSRALITGAMMLSAIAMSGCVIAVAAAGGYVAADEINEEDGKFDPFENVIREHYGEEETEEADGGTVED